MFIWEQGSNLGHLSHLRSPIQAAIEQGHEVFLVARELQGIPTVFGNLPIVCLQAPFKQSQVFADQSAYFSMTHILFRQCFSTTAELEMYICAWRGLFNLIEPELVVYEHAPTALVASFGYGFKKLLVGTGFSIPPLPSRPDSPFAIFITTPRTPENLALLASDDQLVLKIINTALQRCGSSSMGSLSDLYGQADDQLLMTRPELDHFGPRHSHYLGVEVMAAASAPVWPCSEGPKVFGYLNVFPSLEMLLQALQASSVCALLYIRGLPGELRNAYTGDCLKFLDDLLDLRLVAQQADVVISNGSHNTVAHFLQSGVPQLIVPMHQEQLFVGLRLHEQGCAVLAYQDQPDYASEVKEMINSKTLKERSLAMAGQCALLPKIDRSCHIHNVINRLLN
ncbi:MAG: hypothetical protein CFE43_07235 [Burkholderiales bacterium PBB3]|nr:MAG: hypothetical protein CFE43_07235 [Burkholderiales bacterium PBB3]